MHRPTCIFWANLTPFSLKAATNITVFGNVYKTDDDLATVTP
jgi:hypothetical protein